MMVRCEFAAWPVHLAAPETKNVHIFAPAAAQFHAGRFLFRRERSLRVAPVIGLKGTYILSAQIQNEDNNDYGTENQRVVNKKPYRILNAIQRILHCVLLVTVALLTNNY